MRPDPNQHGSGCHGVTRCTVGSTTCLDIRVEHGALHGLSYTYLDVVHGGDRVILPLVHVYINTYMNIVWRQLAWAAPPETHAQKLYHGLAVCQQSDKETCSITPRSAESPGGHGTAWQGDDVARRGSRQYLPIRSRQCIPIGHGTVFLCVHDTASM